MQYGTLTAIGDGQYLYTPFEELQDLDCCYAFSETIYYETCLPHGVCVGNTIYLTIQVFLAAEDYVSIPYQTPTIIDALGNDSGIAPYTFTQISTPPQYGTATIVNNQILYTPDNLFYGQDELWYVACDAGGSCDTAFVRINVDVSNVVGNIPPMIHNTQINFCKELLGDTDIYIPWNEGTSPEETYELTIIGQAQLGEAYIENTQLHYIPSLNNINNQLYVDTLYYRICETNTVEQYCTDRQLILSLSDCFAAEVTAEDVYIQLGGNSFPEINIPLDIYADFWNPITITPLNEAEYGTAVFNNDQTVTYFPNNDFPIGATDSIQYVVCNSTEICDTAYVSIWSNVYQCCYLGNNDYYQVYAGMAQSLSVLDNDAPNTHIAAIIGMPQYGTLSFTDTSLVYTPVANNYAQQDHFTYLVTNNLGMSDTVSVHTTSMIADNIATNNYVPSSSNRSFTLCEEAYSDEWIGIYDPNPQDTLQIVFTHPFEHGTIDTVMYDNQFSFHYQPDDNYVGMDTLRYEACEINTAEHYCTSGEIVFSVQNCVDNFFANYTAYNIYPDSTTTITINVLNHVYNEDSVDIASVNLLSSPDIGTAVLNPDHTITYTYEETADCYPASTIATTFDYAVCSVTGICDTQSMVMVIHITPSLVTPQKIYVARNQARTLSDVYADNLLYPPMYGTVVINPDHTITYTPNNDSTANANYSDYFMYTHCELHHASSENNVMVRFLDEQDNYLPATIAHDDYATIYNNYNSIAVLDNDVYFDASIDGTPPFTLEIVSPATNGTAYSGNGAIDYVSNDISVADSFRYVICGYVGNVVTDFPTTMCDTATVYIIPYCAENCLYPGDVNNDRTVNTIDLLALGIAAEGSGTPRPNASTIWTGQTGDFWDSYYTYQVLGTSLFINKRYADCNGDGTIATNDVGAIANNYGKNRIEYNPSPIPEAPTFPQANAPLIRLDLPTEVAANGHYLADVYIATEDEPAEDLYGIAFTLRFPPNQIPADSIYFTPNNSYLGNTDELFQLVRINNGEAHIALSRHDWNGQTGYGKIGTLSYYVNDNNADTPPNQSLNFSLSDAYYSDCNGRIGLLNYQTTSQLLMPTSVPISTTQTLNSVLKAYPNPTKDLLYLETSNNQPIQSVQICDLNGKTLYSKTFDNINNSNLTITTLSFPKGLYIVQVRT